MLYYQGTNYKFVFNQCYPLQNSSLGQLHTDGDVVPTFGSSAGSLQTVWSSACPLLSCHTSYIKPHVVLFSYFIEFWILFEWNSCSIWNLIKFASEWPTADVLCLLESLFRYVNTVLLGTEDTTLLG